MHGVPLTVSRCLGVFSAGNLLVENWVLASCLLLKVVSVLPCVTRFHLSVLLSYFQTFLLLLVVTSLSKMSFYETLGGHCSSTRKDNVTPGFSHYFNIYVLILILEITFILCKPGQPALVAEELLLSQVFYWDVVCEDCKTIWLAPAKLLIFPKLCLTKYFMTSTDQYK